MNTFNWMLVEWRMKKKRAAAAAAAAELAAKKDNQVTKYHVHYY